MAGNKYLKNVSGVITEEVSSQTSAGVADAGKIVALNPSGVLDATVVNSKTTSAGAADAGKVAALDATGKIDSSMMPVGLGSENDVITASEALSAGDFVNIWSSTGAKVRKADAAAAGKEAHGFVLAAVESAAQATVYRISQLNNQLTGMTPGAKQYLSAAAAGARVEVAPSATGNVVQVLGVAKSATEMLFQAAAPITLA